MKRLIVANWKMNGNIEMLHQHLEILHDFNAVIALPNIYLALGSEILQKYNSYIDVFTYWRFKHYRDNRLCNFDSIMVDSSMGYRLYYY